MTVYFARSVVCAATAFAPSCSALCINVSDWKDIVAISAGKFHTVGLKADGTVVAVGWNKNGQRNVSGWRNIILPTKP